MSAVDQLLVLLLEGEGSYFTTMLAMGFSDTEIHNAFDQARRLGYTEATGLGADRLTEIGRRRAKGCQQAMQAESERAAKTITSGDARPARRL
jgi:hypothetical protein